MIRHPSGRPIHVEQERKLPMYRSPGEGPVTPRLRIPVSNSIGFRPTIWIDESQKERGQ